MAENKDFEILFELEKSLLKSSVRTDSKKVDTLLDPEFFEFGSSGKIWQRYEIVKSLSEEQGEAISSFDFAGHLVADGVILVTYKTQRTGGPLVLRSSLWRKNEGQWRMFFHQGTKAE